MGTWHFGHFALGTWYLALCFSILVCGSHFLFSHIWPGLSSYTNKHTHKCKNEANNKCNQQTNATNKQMQQTTNASKPTNKQTNKPFAIPNSDVSFHQDCLCPLDKLNNEAIKWQKTDPYIYIYQICNYYARCTRTYLHTHAILTFAPISDVMTMKSFFHLSIWRYEAWLRVEYMHQLLHVRLHRKDIPAHTRHRL